jgi:hypothetical protein
VRVVIACTVATLVFAAITMNWFRIRTRWWENLLLALAVALLFRPDFFMDQLTPEYREVPAAQVFEVAKGVPSDESIVMVIKGTTLEGEEISKTVAVQLAGQGPDGRKRLADAGLQLVPLGQQMQIGAVKFGSRAKKGGVEQGWDLQAVKVRTDRPTPHWFYLPALLLIGLVWLTQGLRMRSHPVPA